MSAFADRDPTTRLLIERVLAQEEDHAHDMHDLLIAHDGTPMLDHGRLLRPGGGGGAASPPPLPRRRPLAAAATHRRRRTTTTPAAHHRRRRHRRLVPAAAIPWSKLDAGFTSG